VRQFKDGRVWFTVASSLVGSPGTIGFTDGDVSLRPDKRYLIELAENVFILHEEDK
jgi:hypothetical protein